MWHASKYQWQLFCLALGFFSRLPIPSSTPYSEARMNQAGRYFALVGAILGALCALVYGAAQWWLPSSAALFVMMVFSLMLTGAFHEDGLTDMADGIGGGMTTERRLEIMKDSRIGTYGASALIMALLGKFVLLSELIEQVGQSITAIGVILIVGYTLSRAVAASLIFDMPYVSDLGGSKSKPLAQRQTRLELGILLMTAAVPCLFLSAGAVLALVIVAVVFRFGFKRWLQARLGGFTGDCLGAAQQIMELLCYLTLLALGGPILTGGAG